jgi:hypothetical protein
MAHLIDLIPFMNNISELTLEHLALPLNDAQELKNSSLVYHTLCDDQAHGIIAQWKLAAASTQPITIWNSNMDLLCNVGFEPQFATGFVLDRLWNDLGSATAGPACADRSDS